MVWLLAWAAGYGVARRREQMEAYRRLMRREAVVNERVRIARELHDVIGHTVNTMLVQAGAGRVVLDTDPDRARELLVSVERTGRNALAELDRVLGVLRSDDEPEPAWTTSTRWCGRWSTPGWRCASISTPLSAAHRARIRRRGCYRAGWNCRRTGSCRRG